MKETKSQLADSLMKFVEAALIDLPAAVTLRAFRRAEDKDVYLAGWKAYDALSGIAAELTNRVYVNKTIGRMAGRAIDATLQTQRLADAVAGSFFAALWPSLGLPTASDIEGLRLDV